MSFINVENNDDRAPQHNTSFIIINKEELDGIVQLIRDNTTNSAHMVYKLVKYFRAGIIPAQLMQNNILNMCINKSPIFFSNDFRVKQEQKTYDDFLCRKVDIVCFSMIDRNNLLGAYAPPGKFYRSENKTIDLTVPQEENYDWYEQKCVYYKDLNHHLKITTDKDINGRSFGMVTLGRCNEYASSSCHIIFYISTESEVKFISISKHEDKYMYDNIEDAFIFADNGNINIDINTFGTKVFYTPLNLI